MKLKYSKYLLIAILTAVFILPSGIVSAQIIDGGNAIDTAKLGEGVYDVLNPFSAGPSACGVSGEGLCQSSCGPYDIANIDSKYCSDEEQCCIKTTCRNNESGLGDCRTASNCGELTSKYTTDCNRDQVPAGICCITPKITEITCPGGVCSDDNNFETNLNSSLSSICVEGFKSDFCDEYNSNCSQDPNSFMCQQTLLNLTNNATVSACAENPLLAECLKGTAACSQDPNSSDCLQFTNPSSKGLVPESCPGFDPVTHEFKCSLCSLFELLKNIIDWLVGFTISISAGFIVWAGIQMMFSGGDSSAVTKARETATTAVYGVALALGGWLIIGTLLGALTGSDKIMPWNKITCSAKPIDIGAEVATQSAACAAAGGTCQNIMVLCGGEWKSKLCGGTDNIKCCVPNAVTIPKETIILCRGSLHQCLDPKTDSALINRSTIVAGETCSDKTKTCYDVSTEPGSPSVPL